MQKAQRSLAFAFVILALALASCAERGQIPAKGFEGTITEVIQVPGIGDLISNMGDSNRANAEGGGQGLAMLGAMSNMQMKIYVRPDKVAYDMEMLGGLLNMRTIIDRNARTMTVLMPNHTAMVRNLRSFDTIREKIDDSLRSRTGMFDSLMNLLPQPTGKHETIQGLDAEEYHASKGAVDVDMWLSADDRIKTFEIIRDAFLGRARTGTGGMEQIFDMMRPIGGKIPVKFESKLNGKVFAKGEMTDITEEKLDDAIFLVPQDYTIVNADSAGARRRARRMQRDEASPDSAQPSFTGPPPTKK